MDFYTRTNFSIIRTTENVGSAFGDFVGVFTLEYITGLIFSGGYNPLIFALIGSTCTGLCGIFPLLVISSDLDSSSIKAADGARKQKILLSFSVGAVLGDVFIHMLPEAWESRKERNDAHYSLCVGLWVLSGLLAFIIIEKAFSSVEKDKLPPIVCLDSQYSCHNDLQVKPQTDPVNNNNKSVESKKVPEAHAITGYLNLVANSIDNFTHGLSIGTSFCVSFRLGLFSTLTILAHELPHEVGDFAILLRSGFSRWEAARAQVLTATAGIFGSMVAVWYGAADASTSWILPFSAGGFLHISLVSVLPDIIREESLRESAKQLLSLLFGIALVATLNILLE